MTFHVALFATTPDGGINLLGRTDEFCLVEPVRARLIEIRNEQLHYLDPSNPDPFEESNEPQTAF